MDKMTSYSVIPTYVISDKRLKDGSKLLYGIVTSLSNRFGYCYATNSYLAEILGVTNRSIGRYLEELKECDYITTELIRKENNEIEERKIWLNDLKRAIESNKGLIENEPYVSWMK